MRKLSFILVMVLSVSFVNAQKSKVTSAANYLNAGKLDKAKEAIDTGIKDAKASVWPKSYVVKGKVYQGIFESPLPAFKELSATPLEIAYEAYMKAMELDVKGKYKKQIKLQMSNLIPDFTNKAIEKYNAENFTEALVAFERVLEIEGMEMFKENNTIDTAVIFNAGMAAQKGEVYEKAIKYYKMALDNNYGGARTYAFLSNSYKSNNQPEEAVKYLHKGFELYPNDSYMLVELINYYMLGGEPEKAAEYLDKAIEMDPENGSFYRAKGTLYEKTTEFDKAEEMYKKALELDPKDFTSQYNLGLLKLNKAIAHHKEVNEIMDPNKYNTEIKVVYQEYKEVIPFFEKVLEINPEEKNSMITLKELYFKLRNEDPSFMDKYNEVKAKLESME
ncbi:MAG: tetratricopeptide repeat protein [Marinifilaceae bacterium]